MINPGGLYPLFKKRNNHTLLSVAFAGGTNCIVDPLHGNLKTCSGLCAKSNPKKTKRVWLQYKMLLSIQIKKCQMCHELMNRLKKNATPGLKGHNSRAPEIARSSKRVLIFPFNESHRLCKSTILNMLFHPKKETTVWVSFTKWL